METGMNGVWGMICSRAVLDLGNPARWKRKTFPATVVERIKELSGGINHKESLVEFVHTVAVVNKDERIWCLAVRMTEWIYYLTVVKCSILTSQSMGNDTLKPEWNISL